MEATLLCQDAKEISFKGLDDLRDHLKKNKYQNIAFAPTDASFEISSEGAIMAKVGGAKLRFTESGFARFCDCLHVPDKFVRRLPTDNIIKDLTASLFNTNLKELTLIVSDDRIVTASPQKHVISNLEVVDNAFKTNHKTFKDISLDRENLIVNFTKEVEIPLVNEQFDTGMNLNHHYGYYPQLNYYVWRQVCSNGAVARTFYKIAKFSSKMNSDKMFSVLEERVGSSLAMVNGIFGGAMRKMSNTKIPTEETKYLKKFLSRRLDWKNHDDGYERFDAAVTLKDGPSYFDLMNFVTDFAKGFEIENKNRIESIGGDMISYFKETKPSSELFKGYSEWRRKAVYKEEHAE